MDKNNPPKNNSTFSSSEIRTLEKDIAALKGNQPSEHVAPKIESPESFPRASGSASAPVPPPPPPEIVAPEAMSPEQGPEEPPAPPAPPMPPISREIPEPPKPERITPTKIFKNPFLDENNLNNVSNEARSEGLPVLNKEKRSTVNSLHTFSSDVAEAVKSDHTSVATIATAENARRNKEGRRKEESAGSHAIKIFFMVVIGLLLIGAGSGAFYYFVFIYTAAPTVNVQQAPKEIIASDTETSLSISNIDRTDFIKEIDTELSKPAADGNIEHINLTRTIAGSTTPAEPVDFLSLLQTEAPAVLIRSFQSSFFFGIHESGTTSQAFLILKSNSFSNTIAGMGQWEKTMVQDLQDIFLQLADRLVGPTYTATATGDTYTFQDGVLDNENVRIAQDAKGKIVLMYAFIDNSTLVITTDEATLKEIQDRIIKAQFVR